MRHCYQILAGALEYPGPDFYTRLDRFTQVLTIQTSEGGAQFIGFRRKVERLSVEKMQELYTQTFDLNPVCTLDVGYHLFGENYKRGELLAKLRETEEPYEIGQANQLPDHLPVLLRLIEKLEDEELRMALIAEVLIPALGKMVEALGQTDNPYLQLIEAIGNALNDEVPAGWKGAGEETPELYRISSRA